MPHDQEVGAPRRGGRSRPARIARLLCGALAAAWSPPAAGQAAPPERRVDVGVSLDALYDSNVARGDKVRARARGLVQEDVRITPALTANIVLPVGVQSVSLSASAGYDVHLRNPRLDRERIGAEGGAALRFGRCEAASSLAYARRRSELGDLAVIGAERSVIRNVEQLVTSRASAACGGPVGVRPYADVEAVRADNSAEILRRRDFRSVTATAGAQYVRPSLGEVTLFGRYAAIRYPNFVAVLGGGGGDVDVEAVGVRFEREIGSRLTGLVELAYTAAEPEASSVARFEGLTWRVDLTARAAGRLRVSLDAARSVRPSNLIDSSYFVEELYGVDARYAIGPRLEATLAATATSRKFEGAGQAFGPALLDDDLRQVSGGLNFRPNRRLLFRLFAARERRNANGDFFDYSSTRVGLGAGIAM